MKIFGFGSEKSGFPALENCLPYFSNPDIEENRYFIIYLKSAQLTCKAASSEEQLVQYIMVAC
jgi:hypothetical protein